MWRCFIGLGYCQELLHVFCFCTNCKSLWNRASASRPNCHVFMSTFSLQRSSDTQLYFSLYTTSWKCSHLFSGFSEISVSFSFCLVFSNVFLNFCRAWNQGRSPAVQRGGHRDRDSQVWDRDFRGGHSCHLETEGRDTPPVCCKIKHWLTQIKKKIQWK